MDNTLLHIYNRLHRNASTAFGPTLWIEDPDEADAALAARQEMVSRYSWAIPTDPVLDMLAAYSPIVEIGAGRGYWAGLLKARGANVICYDEAPATGEKHNRWHPQKRGPGAGLHTFAEVLQGTPWSAARHPDRTLFLCWPPFADSMAIESVRAWGGSLLIYIGEGEGGCTGSDDFHEALRLEFEEIAEHQIPQWQGLHDRVHVYRRKTA